LKNVSSVFSARSFAVAAVYAVATAMSACSSEGASPPGNDAGTGGSPSTGGSGGGAAGSGAAPDAQAECTTSDQCTGGKQCVDGACVDAPPACKQDDECTPETECIGGKCTQKVVCPPGLEATFDSIHTKVFAVSCGTSTSGCHSRKGSVNSGGLNLADDPYTALLGADGKGAPAGNIEGSEKDLLRVVPGDPDASFLVIKLSTRSSQDPKYGSGMPFGAPGSVCPDALATIRKWVEDGAKK
jgi:hypothetical protein